MSANRIEKAGLGRRKSPELYAAIDHDADLVNGVKLKLEGCRELATKESLTCATKMYSSTIYMTVIYKYTLINFPKIYK